MKKFFIAMIALMSSFFTTANAMSYEQAREQALFLTDKMAYELNLNEAQYEAAYEINLDYLMSVNTYDDVYAACWVHRNTDFRYILFDWQYNAFIAASYFYRPLFWDAGCWHFGIYARYPHRTYFYFGRPAFYVSYRGGHAWHMNGGRSYYHGRHYGSSNHSDFHGMRDGWNRGDYKGGHQNLRSESASRGDFSNRGNRSVRGNETGRTQHNGTVNRQTREGFSGSRTGNEGAVRRNSEGTRQSSTRTTVNQPRNNESRTESRRSSSSFTPSRSTSTTTTRSYSPSTSRTAPSASSRSSMSASPSRSSGSFSSHSMGSGASRGSFSHGGGASHGGASHGGGSHGGVSFGGRR